MPLKGTILKTLSLYLNHPVAITKKKINRLIFISMGRNIVWEYTLLKNIKLFYYSEKPTLNLRILKGANAIHRGRNWVTEELGLI